MKIYLRIFLLIFFSIPSFCLENKTYSISVCTTSSQESANICKEGILKTSHLETFIQENTNKSYSTYLGNFTTYDEAKSVLNNSSNFIKKQKPFVKEIENNNIKEKITDTQKNIQQKFQVSNRNIDDEIKEIDKKIKEIDQNIILIQKEKALAENQKIEKEKNFVEEQKRQALTEAHNEKEIRRKIELESQKIKDETKISSTKIEPITTLDNIDNFENLIIKVNSLKNIMSVKGKNKNGEIIDIKSYVVSTAKNSIKKPQGVGSITSISLNPQWNPTNKTLKVFKEKGIDLPSVVPFGDKLNYMGAAKINLSHKVNGQEVYRIHGTISENTIGTNESSGCIRMKNKEVVELATLLDKFSKIKSLNNISVVLE